jgi:hypothetical protein
MIIMTVHTSVARTPIVLYWEPLNPEISSCSFESYWGKEFHIHVQRVIVPSIRGSTLLRANRLLLVFRGAGERIVQFASPCL